MSTPERPGLGHFRFDANLKWLFTDLPFERRFDAAARAGFAGVEYPDPYPYERRLLTGLLEDSGLEQVLINTPAGATGTATQYGAACVPGAAREFRDSVLRGLDYASALGCSLLHVRAGARPSGVDRDHAFANLVHNIGWAVEQARGTGVHLVLEVQNTKDVPCFALESQAQAGAVVELFEPGSVGLLFDTYHVELTEGSVVDTLRDVMPHVLHIQVGDPPRRIEPSVTSDAIDWRAFFDVLVGDGYTGWIGCEYRPRSSTASDLTWTRGLTA